MSGVVNEESFKLFTYYVALKNHFSKDDYDFFKYNGKMGLTSNSLDNRKDKSFFYTVAKKQRNPKGFIFANILENPNIWIGDMITDKDKSEKIFSGWERRMQSLSYIFKDEIGKLEENFDSNFLCQNGKHPPLLRKYLRKEISIETIIILDMILNFVRRWDKAMPNDPIWEGISRKIKKYKPFLSISVEKFKGMLKDRFVE